MSQATTSNYYEFFCPVKLVAGKAALENIPFELGALQAKRPLIIADKGVVGAGLLKHIEAVFHASDAEIGAIFDDVPPDSSMHTVREAAEAYRSNNCDAILAVGGGSVIDTSKCANILVSEGGDDLLKYSGAHNLPKRLKPFFVIPTTAGTGSEVTMVAVISDTDRGVKVPFTSYFLMPNAAIIDPRMTQTLPPHITAMTGMDALTHAVEAYTGMAHNPVSDAYATAAIAKISQNLTAVMNDPKNPDGRLELAQAATMAGVAFSNSMVGLVHALGHSAGAVCHLPHGLCMSLFLPYVLEYNKSILADRIADLLLPLAGADIYAATPAAQRADAAIARINELRDEMWELCQLPRTLQETGKVTEEQLAEICELTIDDGSIAFNPKESDRDEIMGVLKLAWGA